MPKYTELRAKRNADGEYRGGGVYRKTVEPFDHRGRKVIVGLEPGDVITFREERTRKTYTLSIRWAMMQAIKNEAEAKAREKNKAKGKVVRRRRVKRGIL